MDAENKSSYKKSFLKICTLSKIIRNAKIIILAILISIMDKLLWFQDTSECKDKIEMESINLNDLEKRLSSSGCFAIPKKVRVGRYEIEIYLEDKRPQSSKMSPADALELSQKYGDTGWFPKSEIEALIEGKGFVVVSAMFDLGYVKDHLGKLAKKEKGMFAPYRQRIAEYESKIFKIAQVNDDIEILHENEFGDGWNNTFVITSGYKGMICVATKVAELCSPGIQPPVMHISQNQPSFIIKAKNVVARSNRLVLVNLFHPQGEANPFYQCLFPYNIPLKKFSELERKFIEEVNQRIIA